MLIIVKALWEKSEGTNTHSKAIRQSRITNDKTIVKNRKKNMDKHNYKYWAQSKANKKEKHESLLRIDQLMLI
jgi:hypothetical protein